MKGLPLLFDDALILDHASGAAPAALSVLTRAQAELCPRAAERVAIAESAFGALLESQDTAELSEDSFKRVLERIGANDAGSPARHKPRKDEADGLYPAAIREALAKTGALHWKRRFGGRKEIRLEALCEPGVRAELIALEPGRVIPRHDHEAEEYTLLLSGALSDEAGTYRRGDLCVAGPGRVHRPRVEGAQACICYAVSLGGMRFTNPLLAAAHRLGARQNSMQH